MCVRYYETVLMLGSETEQYRLCTDLSLQKGSLHEVTANGNSCTQVLNNNSLYNCL